MLAAFAFGLLAAFPGAIAAQDSVKARYVPSYPPPDRSSESVQLSVTRIAAAMPGRELDVDRYFATVRAILDEDRVPERWASVTVDASWVELEIALGTRRHVLASTWGPDGPVLQPNATADDRRIAAALRKLLGFTVDRARRTLATP